MGAHLIHATQKWVFSLVYIDVQKQYAQSTKQASARLREVLEAIIQSVLNGAGDGTKVDICRRK